MSDETKEPDPGSDEAIKAGCTCPVMDNRHGKGYRVVGGVRMFVMNDDCPVHGGKFVPDRR